MSDARTAWAALSFLYFLRDQRPRTLGATADLAGLGLTATGGRGVNKQVILVCICMARNRLTWRLLTVDGIL
jgi:hypothetical protein